MMLGLLFTITVYLISKRLYRRCPYILLSPLIVCPAVLILLLTLLHIPYAAYDAGGHYLTLMLQPATVAFAIPLYKYRDILKRYMLEIASGVTGGAVAAILTTVGIAHLVGLNSQLATSLAPRSITTPMAMNVAQVLGGDPAITAVFVIITGVTGVVLTSMTLKWASIERPLTKGMLFGIAAHGTGTARAYETGSLEGSIASLAMIFMGLITTVIAPVLVPLCVRYF